MDFGGIIALAASPRKTITSTGIFAKPVRSGKESTVQSTKTILDAHVHFHECFDISNFLDQAYSNFSTQISADSSCQEFSAALLLTESYGTDWFRTLRQSAGPDENFPWRDWRIRLNDEDESVTAISRTGQTISIVAGRQIVTAERLEILALGLNAEVKDGLPIEQVIAAVQEKEAICVLPWGFGKWTGQRGKVVHDILDSDVKTNFFIGDNAGRLALWPAPPEFAAAAAKNIRILPGSDPLPYAEQVGSVARFGFMMDGGLDEQQPFRDIRQKLLLEDTKIEAYGPLERLMPFIKYQVAMQLRKFS